MKWYNELLDSIIVLLPRTQSAQTGGLICGNLNGCDLALGFASGKKLRVTAQERSDLNTVSLMKRLRVVFPLLFCDEVYISPPSSSSTSSVVAIDVSGIDCFRYL